MIVPFFIYYESLKRELTNFLREEKMVAGRLAGKVRDKQEKFRKDFCRKSARVKVRGNTGKESESKRYS